jgi:hypothetical protein
MAAKQGQNILLSMSIRTRRIPFFSVLDLFLVYQPVGSRAARSLSPTTFSPNLGPHRRFNRQQRLTTIFCCGPCAQDLPVELAGSALSTSSQPAAALSAEASSLGFNADFAIELAAVVEGPGRARLPPPTSSPQVVPTATHTAPSPAAPLLPRPASATMLATPTSDSPLRLAEHAAHGTAPPPTPPDFSSDMTAVLQSLGHGAWEARMPTAPALPRADAVPAVGEPQVTRVENEFEGPMRRSGRKRAQRRPRHTLGS